MNKHGQLYIFEGIDNVGKTSIINGLCDKLSNNKIDFSRYSFPGKELNTLGSLVYDIHHNMRKYVDDDIHPISLQLLHIASHIDIIYKKIIPDLCSGKMVILDRFWWSTYAYGKADDIDFDLLKQILKIEIDSLRKIKIGKIFFIRRKDSKSEYNKIKYMRILESYNELINSNDYVKKVYIIDNKDLKDTINQINNIIMLNEKDNYEYNQIDFFKNTINSPHMNTNFNLLSKPVHSKLYDVYWRFASSRQEVFFKKLEKKPLPLTSDKILQKYKFTNAYRAADRTSQFLIRNVIYSKNFYSSEDMIFRILLFKIFNKIETWQHLEKELGDITFKNYSFNTYDKILSNLIADNKKIYSAAYIMPSGKSSFGYQNKHRNNLMLLEYIMKDGITSKIARAKDLKQLYEIMLGYPTIGKFLAYQYSIDINYSELCDFSEMSFVAAGPGAKRGIKKCFTTTGSYTEEDIIKYVSEIQNNEFYRLNLDFRNLWGRPLQLIDCQNLFCEVDKYTRVSNPEYENEFGQKRIKQNYIPSYLGSINYFFPPKWGIRLSEKEK